MDKMAILRERSFENGLLSHLGPHLGHLGLHLGRLGPHLGHLGYESRF